MRKRLIYGSGVAVLVMLAALVIWQGSLNYHVYRPKDTAQTVSLWAISTLIFLLMVTLGFMLVRDGVKLFVERRMNREGSRIKTKLVAGALALSFMPVLFMLFFTFVVMSHNLERWFAEPVDIQRADFIDIANALTRELQDKVNAQAALLAALPETRAQLTGIKVESGFLTRFCTDQHLAAASIYTANSAAALASCGTVPSNGNYAVGRHLIYADAREIGSVKVICPVPLDVLAKRSEIEEYNAKYLRIVASQHAIRQQSLLLLMLISIFILFVATWIALFLAKQISVPIAALVNAAEEVGRGNLAYRVNVGANDELASLVRGFNRMTEQLEGNSRELDTRRRFTEAILENIPTGVISMAADGKIQRVNRALSGILPAELVANAARLEDLFPREETAEIRYLMKRARRTGIASQQLELKFGTQTLHLAVTVSALEDRSRSGFVMVIEDTSDLLRAQRAAAWNEVARRVAHEIKNPLTPIGLSAERIQRQLDRMNLPPETRRIVRECTETIVNEVQSVKSLVDEFAQFARFPAPQPVTCSLNTIVESAVSVFSGRLEGIEIRIDLAPSLPPVFVDREQLKRVVVNLIDNAAEAMQESPLRRLHIVTQAGPADSIELIIADTGAGVSAEDKEKLFVPYFSTKGRGTGLGLAIVNNILTDHNAHIRVEDNAPAGTRFTIEISTEEPVSEPVVELAAQSLTQQ